MWKHVLYIRFFSTVISASNKVDQAESDVSIADPKVKAESDVSYIDDRFIRPGEIEPQILKFTYNKSPNDTEDIDYQWGTPGPDEQQRIDFHLDLPDSNKPHILELKLKTPKTMESRKSFLHGRRYSNSSRRNMNYNPLKIIRGNRELVESFLTSLNFPYMAAIIINGRLWCAGSIVDENWVLTAAHCLNFVLHVSPLKYLGDHVKVRVGSTKAHEGGQVLDVVGAVRHPKFEEEPAPHADIALLKLAVHLELGKYVNIIKIYGGVKEPLAQSFVVVAGWGATKSSDLAFREPTPDLGVGRMKVRSQSYCIDSYQLVNDFQFTPELFCASIRNGTRDACLISAVRWQWLRIKFDIQPHLGRPVIAELELLSASWECNWNNARIMMMVVGCNASEHSVHEASQFDAGAPAVQQNMLMGVMSFGPERCGLHAQPAVFIKAFYFRDFVKNTIAAYKTTKELIQAMHEMSMTVKPDPNDHAPSFLLGDLPYK